MPSGYLVSLGDGILNPSDPITGPLTDFTTADILGNGSWTWSGTWTGNGTNYSNITDTGIYYLGTDGNTYFIPTNWFVDPITTASVTTDPSIDGTAGNDVINDSYTDPDGKTLDATDNVIHTGAGNDTIITNGAVNGSADTVFAGSGNDTVITGRGDDVVYGEAGDDTIEGGSGADRLDGGDGVDTISGGSGNDTLDVTGAGPTRVYYDVGNPENGTIEFLDGTGAVTGTLTFSEIENVNFVPCFTAGTMITTARGEIAMQDLKVGDMVLTRDSGFQAIRWIGSTAVKAVENFAPIRFAKGALGNNEEMLISPQHRVLLSGWKAEMLFGEAEVLASARSLVNGRNITVVEGGEVEYFHMMFDRHEIVLSDKAWTESFHPGDVALDGMAEAARDEIFTLFPELKSDKSAYGSTARQVVKPHEVAALVDGSNALCQV
jgi:hypothetical protein